MYVNLPKQDSTSPPNCDLTSCWFARVTMLRTSFWFAFSSFSYWICKKGTCLEIREQCKCSLPRQCTYKLEVEWANPAKINWQANFATVMLKKTFLTVLRFRLAELHMERHGWIWISSQSQNAQLSLSVSFCLFGFWLIISRATLILVFRPFLKVLPYQVHRMRNTHERLQVQNLSIYMYLHAHLCG